jgi:hypothetical protein
MMILDFWCQQGKAGLGACGYGIVGLGAAELGIGCKGREEQELSSIERFSCG